VVPPDLQVKLLAGSRPSSNPTHDQSTSLKPGYPISWAVVCAGAHDKLLANWHERFSLGDLPGSAGHPQVGTRLVLVVRGDEDERDARAPRKIVPPAAFVPIRQQYRVCGRAIGRRRGPDLVHESSGFL
jgi:hypothetical protein